MKKSTRFIAILSVVVMVLQLFPISIFASENAFTDVVVTDAALWVRADRGVETDTNGVLTKWTDQSGNSKDGTVLGSYAMPKLAGNSINGQPALKFEGGTQIVNFPVPMSGEWSKEFSVFFVYKPSSLPSSGKHFIGCDDWRMFNLHTYDTTGGLYTGITDTYNSYPERYRIKSIETAGTYVIDQTVVMQFTYQDGMGSLRKNGVKIIEKEMPEPITWSKFTLGLAGTDVGLDGEFAEMIIFDEAISAEKQSNVSKYLRSKYLGEQFVAEIQLNETSKDLTMGDTMTLTATVLPAAATNKAVAWTSSDTAVAIVDPDGTVHAVGAGTVTITATSADNSAATATCEVTVGKGAFSNYLLKDSVLWLDAAKVEKDTNNVLTKWPDQSANGHDGVAYTGNSMPIYVENGINGLPVVRFETESGTKDAVDIPNLTGNMDNFSVFFVFKPKTFDSPNNHVVRAKGEWKQFIMHTYSIESKDGSIYIGTNVENRFNTQNAGKGYYIAGEWNILEFRAQGSNVSLYKNGVLLETMDCGSKSAAWTGFDMGVVDQMQGDAAELLIYNRQLSADERTYVSQYLQQKYYGYVVPESFSITSSNGTYLTERNNTTQLTVQIDPESLADGITWSITDSEGNATEAATVDSDGLLTAQSNGTVIVTATHTASGSTASLQLTVKIAITYEVTGNKTISSANGTTQLTALCNGEAVTGIIWSIYGENLQPTDIAWIDNNGTVTAQKNGTVIVVGRKGTESWAANVNITGQTFNGDIVNAIYVSVDGDDAASGSFDAPKKTIATALSTGIDYVYVMAGSYDLSEPLYPQSGTTLAGYPMGEVLITGGIRVPDSTKWTHVDGQPYYVTDFAAPERFRELYVNGEHAQLAESDSYTASWYFENGAKRGYQISGLDLTANTDSNLEMHWNHRYWRCNRLVVDEVRVENGETILLPEPESFEWATVVDFEAAGPLATEPFTLLNDRSFLTDPGEWFYDENNQKLYYYPKDGESFENLDFYIPQIDTLVELSGPDVNHKLSDVTIDNLHFAYTTWQRAIELGSSCVQADFVSNGAGNGSHTDAGELPSAVIHSEFAENITIQNCDIRNTGANAIILENAVHNSIIQNNVIEDIAFTAITISRLQNSFLDQENEEVPKDNLIFNNRINNAAFKYHSGSGICGYYTDGLTVDHNDISHTAWAGVTFGWNGWQATEKDSVTHRNLTVTNNYIYSFAEVSRDSGGLYTLGQCPNAIIAYNHLEKIVRDYAGIYNDEGSAYYYVYKNVIDGVPNAPINWWTSSIHDMYAEGNYYSDGSLNNNATRGYHVNETKYSINNRPAEAQDIVDNAGLTDQPHQSIRSAENGDVAYGKNAFFVKADSTTDYGEIGHMPQFALNGFSGNYAKASNASSSLYIDLLQYHDLSSAYLQFANGETPVPYSVEVSADDIIWSAWDANSPVTHVRFVRFIPDGTAAPAVQTAVVKGAIETAYTPEQPQKLNLPQEENAVIFLQAETAAMTNDHLSVWRNEAGGNDARIPDAQSPGLDPLAVANSGYSKKPIVMEGVLNGRPIVRFDGFDDAMQADQVSGNSGEMTFVLHVRPTDKDHFMISSDGFTLSIVDGAYQAQIGTTTVRATDPVQLNTWQTLVLTVSNGTAILRVGDAIIAQGNVTESSVHNTLRIGDNVGIRRKDYGTALGADIAELVLYQSALSEEETDTIVERIARKYAPVVHMTDVTPDQTSLNIQ